MAYLGIIRWIILTKCDLCIDIVLYSICFVQRLCFLRCCEKIVKIRDNQGGITNKK